jgi:dipeptidyl aminopeptidase/acylaminoacyl peptidase
MIRPNHPSEKTKILSATLFVLAFLLISPVHGQEASGDTYMMPPKVIADLIDAPLTPRVSISPDNQWMMIQPFPGLPSIEEVAQPELRLAGLRINPKTNGPSRSWHMNALTLRRISDGSDIDVTGLPDNPKITSVRWSPNSEWISFILTDNDLLELWVAKVKDGMAFRLAPIRLNGAYGSAYTWLSDSKTIIAKTIPDGRGEPPQESPVPSGPTVQENLGRKAPARTYQDLLKNQYDESVFDYYATSQLVRLNLDGEIVPLGTPGIFSQVSPSPDGKLILATTIQKPYSYTVPLYRFPMKVEVWDRDGNMVRSVADLALADNIPVAFGSVRTGPRSFNWRQDTGGTLYWAEAQDGGDAGQEAETRDKIFLHPAPFDQEPVELITLNLRYDDILWGTDDLAIVSSWWWQTRTIQSWRVWPESPEKEPELLIDRSWEDRYNDPGQPMMRLDDRGGYVLMTADKGNTLFLYSSGASPEGDRPFLDKFDLKTHETERLFRSEAPYYEYPIELIDPGKRIMITRRETVDEPPNYFLRDLNKNRIDPLTTFPHPTPQLSGVQKKLIRYEREDGVQLTGTLYLPAGYSADKDGPLPTILWAYPNEYKSADAAGQVTDSPYRFIRVGWWSPMLWLTMGYAVLDDASMPVVGEGEEEPNDSFVKQLVASAKAAIDEIARRGVADPDRVAVGGHSYGAFMTANLLAHSDLFRAGLPRSGAYNRSLTPFGFQSEERTFWEAPEIYFAMSPFMHADKINEPILLVHGEADNNSGTYPLQSERFFGALKGHGATVRLVMLPHESHGYRARESVMHVLWETTEWLEKYVKNAPPRQETDATQ